MNLKYYLGAFISIPLLPLMYYEGKKIKAKVPALPEAAGKEGMYKINSGNVPTLNLITIGESTMAGVGVKTHEDGFTGMLAKQLSQLNKLTVNWKVYARSGYTARKVARKLVSKINQEKADLIVIGLGGNDAFTLNTPSKWRAHLHELITALQTKFPKAYIVFCNMPPIKEFPAFTPLIKFTIGNLVEILGTELKAIVKKYPRVYYYGEVITLRKWIEKLPVKAQKSDFFSDGVHPSKLTYQTWATTIAENISTENDFKKMFLEIKNQHINKQN